MNDEFLNELTKEEKLIFLERYKFAAMYFAVPLVLSFGLVDYFFSPEHFIEFILVRLSIIPVALITYLLCCNEKITNRFHAIPALIGIFYFGIFHAYLVSKSGYELSTYYSGINIATVVFFTFLPWPPKFLPAALILNHLPYIYVVFTHGELNYRFLVPHLSFMLSISFICVVAFFVTRKLRSIELNTRLKLKKQTEVQLDIIKQKTKEGVFLEKLTAQFSPQVIEEIKSDKINLDKKIRREITCIFIDIVNSTDRSVRLDYNKYTTVISDFFSECINIFLKHNVTVGTYLGDGILAFVNAPQDTVNHEVVGFEACVDILKFYDLKKKYYSDQWQNEFKIKISINTGFAYIGFFPSIKRGTYTAIGEAVNLTSRLCSVAPENSICITKSFALKIANNVTGLELKKINESIKIKGFENDNFELYSVSLSSNKGNSNLCPLCTNPMGEVSDFDNCKIIKCTKCAYTDIQDKPSKKAA